jgi:hypothetical protein
MLYRVHLVINGIQTHNVSAKSNYHKITTTTVPVKRGKKILYHALSNDINKPSHIRKFTTPSYNLHYALYQMSLLVNGWTY